MTTRAPAIMPPAPEDSPFDYQSSGTYGLHSATWKQIRTVLSRFGGTVGRSTSKEGSTLYYMPSESQIAAGKPSNINNTVKLGALQQLMQEVRRAEIPAILFLAAMDCEGASFISKSTDVTKASRWMREANPPLQTSADWKKAVRDLQKWITEHNGRPEAQVEAPQSESKPQGNFVYTLREAAELSGADTGMAQNYASTLAKLLSKDKGIGADLKQSGNVQEEKTDKRTRYRLNEAGAMMIGRYVEERLAERGIAPAHEPKVPAVEGGAVPEVAETRKAERGVALPRPAITLNSAAIATAILEYLHSRDLNPNPLIVFEGVRDQDSFTARVEINWESEEA